MHEVITEDVYTVEIPDSIGLSRIDPVQSLNRYNGGCDFNGFSGVDFNTVKKQAKGQNKHNAPETFRL